MRFCNKYPIDRCDGSSAPPDPPIRAIPNGTQVYTTGRKVKKDGYVWYEIMLAGAYDTGWIAGSLIGY